MDATDTPSSGGVPMAKARLRRRLIAARDKIGPDGRAAQAREIAEALLHWAPVGSLPPGAAVAAYVGVGTEPSTSILVEALDVRGVRILLPRWRPGTAEMNWALYTSPEDLTVASAGLLEPQGDALGVDAIARASVIVVPALAVDRTGNRLGRGAGAYDTALLRAAPHARTCALLYSGELVDELPAEPHDRAMSAVAMPGGVVELSRG